MGKKRKKKLKESKAQRAERIARLAEDYRRRVEFEQRAEFFAETARIVANRASQKDYSQRDIEALYEEVRALRVLLTTLHGDVRSQEALVRSLALKVYGVDDDADA